MKSSRGPDSDQPEYIRQDPVHLIDSVLGITPDQLVPNVEKWNPRSLTGKESLEELAQQQLVIDERRLENHSDELKDFQRLRELARSSDSVLKTMQGSLSHFQTDLDSLASDMEALQNRSVLITKRLDTRTKAEEKLSPLVEAFVIPPELVRDIAEGDINARWRASLNYIVRRREELKVLKDQKDFSAVRDSESQVELIIRKAIERIRDYMVYRIRNFRAAGANAQVIQRDLLVNQQLFAFLHAENEPLSEGLRQAYVNTMKWYYHSYFERYLKSLEKLNLNKVDKTVLLGTDDSSRKGLFSRTTTQPGVSMQEYLNLGPRVNIISSDDTSVIVSPVAEKSTALFWMETGFRSLNIALLDNASIEYHFMSTFFKFQNNEQLTQTFNDVFEPTFQLGHAYTKFILTDSFDAYGMLICIRLCRKLEFELQHRKVPIMENYLNLQMINLWPRFQATIDAHCENLRRASTRSSSYSTATSSALVPHQVTQQYASFVSAILSLCQEEYSQKEPVANSLSRLRSDFESFLTKMSSVLSDSSSNRERFLYNNYFLVSTILSVSEGLNKY
jgi:vacuolar protein sorting-associated protein 52